MAGIGILYCSILWRDRLRIALWVLGIAALQVYAVIAFGAIYSDPAELAGYARIVETSPASRAFSGPGYGLDPPTMGAAISNDTLAFLAAAMALMSVFLITRNTRAEEEDGPAELVVAAGVGPHARSAAALAAVGTVNVALGVILAVIMLIGDLEAVGSITVGAASAGCGLAFAGLALLTAQLSTNARVGNAIAGGMLGLAYLLRAVGDMSESGLSWLSPIGWAQAARPFADERFGPLLLLLACAATLTAGALWLEGRRDLGGGFIHPRPGPARGRPYMARFAGLPLRLLRVAMLAWLAGAIVLGITYGSVATEVEKIVADNPEIGDFLTGGGSLTDRYFVTVVLTLSLVATGFAIQSLLRIRSEETAGRAELLLATGFGRLPWALGYAAVTIGGVILIQAGGGFTLGLGYALAGGDAGSMAELTGAALARVPAVLVAAALVALLVGAAPRRALLAWGLLAWFFFVGYFGEPLDLPAWLRDLSPFAHVPDLPAAAFTASPLVALTALAAALGALGLFGLRRRDIG